MKNRKVVADPVQDGPVKAKPGDIEPPPDTKGVPIADPPQTSPTSEANLSKHQGGRRDPARH